MTSQKQVGGLRIFGFVYGFARPYLLSMGVGTFLYCSQQVMFPLFASALMGGVTNAALSQDPSMLLIAGGSALGILALLILMVYPGVLMHVSAGLKTTRRMQTKLFRAFVNADTEGRSHSGDRLSALNVDVENANSLYGDALVGLLMCLVPILMLSAMVFAIEWRVGLLTILIGLIAMWGQYLFAKPIAKIAHGKLEAIANATKTIGDIFAGGVIIRVFRLQERMLSVFGQSNDELLRLSTREARVIGAQKLFAGLSDLMATGGLIVFGSILISRGEMTLTTLMMLVPMCGSIAEALTNIGGAWAGMQAPLTAGRRIYALLNGDNHLEPLANASRPSAAEGYQITVKGLTFSFKGADAPALVDVNLSVDENKLAAFVGESGSGKSTLLKVIMGLYDREGLNISVGDARFSETPIEAWRGHFSYVDQSCTLFNMTIAENIALGKEGATREEIVAAAKEADADGFISALPRAYDTPVGEVGASLSGGQRQRIAIARALVRRAPVLVFDEATSALDNESEREVLATINRLRAKHTILMATHNLSSIQPDIVFQMEKGHAVMASA